MKTGDGDCVGGGDRDDSNSNDGAGGSVSGYRGSNGGYGMVWYGDSCGYGVVMAVMMAVMMAVVMEAVMA